MDEERDLRNCCEEATAERLQQLTHENELLRTFLGGATAMEENGCAAASLTDEEKCDVATAEVTRLETAIFHHQKSIEQEQVAAEAQLGTWEACAAEAASDLAHLKQHVLEQPNVHTGRICAEHLVRFLDDCQRARDAAIDRCTVQAASARAKLHSMEKAGLAEAEAHDPMDAVTLEKLRIEKVGLREEREQCARELLQAKRKKFDLLQVLAAGRAELASVLGGIVALKEGMQREQQRLKWYQADRGVVEQQCDAASRELQAFQAAMQAGGNPRIVDAMKLDVEVKGLRGNLADWERKLQIAAGSAA